jgi:hypothetical protein
VPEIRFTRHCLTELAEIDAGCAPSERATLESALGLLAAAPGRRGSYPSYYDPEHPSSLFRAAPFVVHYHVAADDVVVVFQNVFWRRP